MKIVTSLSFQGQCREAFEFYAEVLGGKITAAMPYADAPPDMPIDGEKHKTWLMHCWLEVGDQALMGADMDIEWAPNVDKPKNGFDVTLHTSDMAEARRWFDRLAEGGKGGDAVRRDFLVARLRRARRQVRGAVDDQRHPCRRLEAGPRLRPRGARACKARAPVLVAAVRRRRRPMARTNPLQFIQQVRAEVAKVTWPTRRETGLTTVMVMIMAALFATFFFLVDLLIRFGLEALLNFAS